MEQPESSAPTVDIPAAVSRRTTEPSTTTTTDCSSPTSTLTRTSTNTNTNTTTSNSVPSLRFPRPVGNRQLTNWISSSHPDIMSPTTFQDDTPLDSGIETGYEVIGTDGESRSDSAVTSDEHQISELGDDVQSLADTDTGTDAYTNDVDTDSSDDEEVSLGDTARPASRGATHTDEEDHEADVETLADRSLEYPTELFTPGSGHISRRSSISEVGCDDPMLERALSAAGLARKRAAARSAEQPKENIAERDPQSSTIRRPADAWSYVRTASQKQWKTSEEQVERFMQPIMHVWTQLGVTKRVLLSLLIFGSLSSFMLGYQMGPAPNQNDGLSTVPVASVSSLPTLSQVIISTSTVTSTVTSTKTDSNSLQTTSSSKSVANVHLPDSDLGARQHLCSAALYSRNEILLKVPQRFKSTWLARHAFMISVSRGASDILSKSTKVTPVDDGFLIQVPQGEAHGILDISIATARKPKINETFHVNMGRFMIVDALDAGKQLMKGFAQTVVDTVNGTTAWVEETCIPAFDLMSKPTSVSDSIVQGIREAGHAALDLPGQVVGQIKQSLTKERVSQAETELLRQAQDIRDELALDFLRAQLNAKLWWLKVSGQSVEYKRYLAAAELHYKKKTAEAVDTIQARAQLTKKEIRARRKHERREAGRPFWKAGEGGF
ncbi:hypothetical protein BJ170DRAFT_640506 [Xylariales sp. AK1849]|nr:hypothetical protein BJ170DRAFT_640506 [Xylariales sp. AK1849]